MDVVGTGPFNLLQGDTVIVAFALIAGDDLPQLRASAQAAQVKYDEYASPGDPQNVNNQSASWRNQLKVYPNPSNGVFTLSTNYEFNPEYSGRIAVYDVLGQLVWSAGSKNLTRGNNEIEIDMRELRAGIYQLQVTTDKGTFNKKIVVE